MTTADAEAYALGVAFFRLLVFLGLCGLVGALIGSKKGEPGLGFIWGVFLGPIGILVVVLSDGNRRPCRFCQEKIHKAAVVCPRCQREGPFPLAAAVPTATPRISPAVGGFVVILLFLLGVVLLMP